MISTTDFDETTTNGTKEYSAYFGTPTHDDHILFELLAVGILQAGLSWQAAASKLPVLRKLFAGMQITAVAKYDEPEVAEIAANPAMIRNPRKIRAIIQDARAILEVQAEFGSFSNYLWAFVNDRPFVIVPDDEDDLPKQSPIGERVAKDMHKRGFKFVGPTVTHMFLIAAGIVQVN